MGKIRANRGYIALLMIFLTAAFAASVVMSARYAEFKLIMIICAVVILSADIAAALIITSYVELKPGAITVKLIKKRVCETGNVNSIEWRFFNQKNGACYINMKDGRVISLPRRLFEKKLYDKLYDFAAANGITQHTPEQ